MVGAAAVIGPTSALAHNGVVVADAPSHIDGTSGSLATLRAQEMVLVPVSHSVALAGGHLDAEPQLDAAANQAAAAASGTTTPVPNPVAAATPAPQPSTSSSQRLATAPSPPAYRNRLISADGSVNTGVGVYSDCSGNTPLVRYQAAIDTCIGGVTYFLGHNPGVFTGLLNESVGSTITYWDGNGTAHTLRIIARRQWVAANGLVRPVGGARYEFQTCLTPSGSVDWIFDAA
jgi:hypothetical protein